MDIVTLPSVINIIFLCITLFENLFVTKLKVLTYFAARYVPTYFLVNFGRVKLMINGKETAKLNYRLLTRKLGQVMDE